MIADLIAEMRVKFLYILKFELFHIRFKVTQDIRYDLTSYKLNREKINYIFFFYFLKTLSNFLMVIGVHMNLGGLWEGERIVK